MKKFRATFTQDQIDLIKACLDLSDTEQTEGALNAIDEALECGEIHKAVIWNPEKAEGATTYRQLQESEYGTGVMHTEIVGTHDEIQRACDLLLNESWTSEVYKKLVVRV